MRGFHNELEHFLGEAVRAEALDASSAARLTSFARGAYRPRGAALQLASVLGWLGGLAIALGAILLVAANWDEIPAGVKIVGMLAFLGGAHALGFRLARSAPRMADALHFLGGGLLIGGIGLIGQVYHLDPDPAGATLLWLLGIAPLAFWLGSGSLTLMAAFALLLWMHLQGGERGAALEMADVASAHLCLELGIGAAFVGLGAFLRGPSPAVAQVLRGVGVLLLLAMLYAFGFYRHFGELVRDEGSPALPLAALFAGVAGLGLGVGRLCEDAPALRPRLLLLLSLVLCVGIVALAADSGWIPRGPAWSIFHFGQEKRFEAVEWIVSIGAWALWFALGLWCVAYGVRTRKNAYVNLGVLSFALGILTNFFDLIGTLAGTGLVYVLGGLVLLGTAWASERWRRNLTARMQAAHPGLPPPEEEA